jgi:cytochrome c553
MSLSTAGAEHMISTTRDPLTVTSIAAVIANGMARQQQMPRLAKQRLDYLIASLKALRENQRSSADTLTSSIVVGMSDADLAALAHYAASR